jgi:hypothetical protein
MVNNDKRTAWTGALMVLVRVCMLFLSGPVASGQIAPPQYPGFLNGTVFYSDGKTPFPLSNNSNYNVKVSNSTYWFSVEINPGGFYFVTANALYPGNYTVTVLKNGNNTSLGSTQVTIIQNRTVTANVTTSRTPTD